MWWELFVGWTISAVHNQGSIAWMLLARGDERAVVIQRTYRDGAKVIRSITDEIVEACRRNAWDVWNSEKGERL